MMRKGKGAGTEPAFALKGKNASLLDGFAIIFRAVRLKPSASPIGSSLYAPTIKRLKMVIYGLELISNRKRLEVGFVPLPVLPKNNR